ncbi:hypothetical protein ACJMK2_014546 [Sinanodonta woodiana]|uniref:Uncharacterized protein n=1 Tax=Sinanodonta woodiana TaxID=1069815 RepID=A0ABD3V1P8_SINWO
MVNCNYNEQFYFVSRKWFEKNTCYEFKVRAVFDDDDEGPFSEICGDIKTSVSLSEHILHEEWIVKRGQPSTYKLPLTVPKETVNTKAKSRQCIFVKKQSWSLVQLDLEKSTLINGMVNYILRVEWEDTCRFTIIDLTDEEKGKKDETESQTEWITCYTIPSCPGSQLNYTLNIIDTPGFGDTRGITRDQEIVDQIRELFTTPPPQGIQTLDAVCEIFDSVLSIFGNDISKNIFVLITFADGNEPPVKMALEAAHVPFQKTFKFNNSALFVSTENKDDAQIGQMFWKMGKESFHVFFTELTKTETQSLQLTADVLKTRQQLEATIQGLQPKICEGLNVINTIKQEKQAIDKHQADILATKAFEFEVDGFKQILVPLESGVYVTNCLTCNRTCHYPCGIPNDRDKRGCAAMNSDGYCNICSPKKCYWSEHHNTQHRFELVPTKVKQTSDDLKKKYEIAVDEEKKHSEFLKKVKDRFNHVGESVFAMIKRVRDCINELKQKAIKQNPLSQVEYIEILIEAERSEAKYGWQKRVEMYQSFKKQAELMKDIPNQTFKHWTDDQIEALLNDNEDFKR